MYPGFEVERRSLDESLDVFWWSWSQAMAGTIIRTVMRHFHTDTGSISFFDQDNELFKVENGYSKAFVARSVSIAAHVLLSDDVLVILDTHKVCSYHIIKASTNGSRIGGSNQIHWLSTRRTVFDSMQGLPFLLMQDYRLVYSPSSATSQGNRSHQIKEGSCKNSVQRP